MHNSPRTLLITPFFDAALPSGGALLSIDVAREWLRAGRRVAVACARRDRALGDLQRFVDRGQLSLHPIADDEQVRFTHHPHESVAAATRRLLAQFCPDCVHVHNTQGLLSAVRTALDLNFRTILTALDFGLICLNYCLYDGTAAVCRGPTQPGKCGECVRRTLRPTARWISRALPRGLTRALWPRFVRLDQIQQTRALLDLALGILRDVHAIVAPSPSLGRVLAEWRGDASAIHEIAYGVRSLMRPEKQPSNALRLAYLGGAERVKGFDLLLTAAAALPDRLPLRIEAFGGDALRRRLTGCSSAARYVSIRPPCFGAALAAAHACIDAVVVPSICHENSPFVILESFACGTPVIAARQPGIAHLVHSGLNGWLVTPCDPRAWATALEHAARDPQALRQLAAGAHWERTTADFVRDVTALETAARPVQSFAHLQIIA